MANAQAARTQCPVHLFHAARRRYGSLFGFGVVVRFGFLIG
jgi:hypothetical protein